MASNLILEYLGISFAHIKIKKNIANLNYYKLMELSAIVFLKCYYFWNGWM